MAQRWQVRVKGVVQGVGYRPFVYRQAMRHDLAGWVRNDPQGVLVEVQSDDVDTLLRFVAELSSQAPPQAVVESVDARTDLAPGAPDEGFRILGSGREGRRVTIVPPDGNVCADCLAELRDPADRRYRYPFTNCTNCGPRYSIVRALPYDRANTTMRVFPMCPACQAEYDDPADRRYHAQPNACPVCGPRLWSVDQDGDRHDGDDALRATARALRDGQIVAVKGIGGFHLAVDARNGEAIARLRKRKRRDRKPFAVMARDLREAEAIAEVADGEAALLTSPARPIVLVRKRSGALPEEIAPRNPNLGVMLPSAPHHHLLLDEPGLATLVMTSGNTSGHPIAYTNDDALARLFEIADRILLHDRDIEIRVDDSIVRWSHHPELPEPLTTFVRRARGYAPYPVAVAHDLAPVVAYGAELKTTVALSDGARVYLSQHIGDLKNDATWSAHRRTAAHLAALHELAPEHSAADLHPQFRAVGEIRVQHHHAHMSACMAENKLSGPVLGVVFDGAGYGTDGTIWGGEFLLGDHRQVRRVARLRHLPLLGGDKAVREPIRTGFALAADAGVGFPVLETLGADQRHVFAAMARKGINSPSTSSVGRLFDGVAALLGVCTHAEYEAQGPIELEGLLGRDPAMAAPYVFADDGDEVDHRPVIAALAADVAAGVPVATMSRRFHSGVVDMVVRRCRDLADVSGVDTVVLSGGVFLNEFLLLNCLVRLRAAGLRAHCHRLVPTNDGGIALGQVMVADAQLRAGAR